MPNKSFNIHRWLIPLSWLYGIVIKIRNILFDRNIFTSHTYDLPVICIGNLAVGGTGKTPHTEYLIRLLQNNFQVAVLSRGYKRQSRGYILATKQSTAMDIGDEPFQMKNKFPNIKVAVDINRCEAIEKLTSLINPPIDIILLDDAYQYRYVKSGVSILLTAYDRLFGNDRLLPAGRLREPQKEKKRAQVIIVTKCPEQLSPTEIEQITELLHPYPHQQIFFTKTRYGSLFKLFNATEEKETLSLSSLKPDIEILLVTGIAYYDKIEKELLLHSSKLISIHFPDHHNYTEANINAISDKFHTLTPDKRIIVTTEKDAARLLMHPVMAKDIKENLYVLPIHIDFLQNKKELFNQYITEYVRKNKRNCILSEKENANKS